MNCKMICLECGEEFVYAEGRESKCPVCRSIIEIDEKIEPLILTLNRSDFFTAKSCEGHGWDSGWPHPFVTLYFHKDYKKLDKVLQEYNKSVAKEQRWKIERHPKLVIEKWLIPVETNKRLEKIQRSIRPLTDFLQENALKQKHALK